MNERGTENEQLPCRFCQHKHHARHIEKALRYTHSEPEFDEAGELVFAVAWFVCSQCRKERAAGADAEHPELINLRLGRPSGINARNRAPVSRRARALSARRKGDDGDPDVSVLLTDSDPGADDVRYYDRHEHSPLKAVLMFHSNSGLSGHPGMRALLENPHAENRAELLKSVNQMFEEAIAGIENAKPDIMKAHAAAVSPTREFFSCAACGFRNFSDAPARHALSAIAWLLAYNDAVPYDRVQRARIARAAQRRDAISGVSFDKVFSTFLHPDTQKLYHLIPELVDAPSAEALAAEYSCLLCADCSARVQWPAARRGDVWAVRPPNSVSKGKDFGSLARVGIPHLSPLEAFAVAPNRIYMMVHKFSGANAGCGPQPFFKGHCISFPQHSGEPIRLACASLPLMDLHKRISLQFVGPNAQWEARLRLALPFGDTLTGDEIGASPAELAARAGHAYLCAQLDAAATLEQLNSN